MREMLRGLSVVLVLVVASAAFYYGSDPSDPIDLELPSIDGGPAQDAEIASALAESGAADSVDNPPAVVLPGPFVDRGELERINAEYNAHQNRINGSAGMSVAPSAADEPLAMTPIDGPRARGTSDAPPSLPAVSAAAGESPGLDVQTAVAQSATAGPQAIEYEAERPFSPSTDCKICHPRQYQEWRTSPHSYSGISPTFYSLVAAGQNSFGAGALINLNDGVSQGGAVGNFCLPCHSPMSYIGLEGRFSGNNGGFSDVRPQGPFVCDLASTTPFAPCTAETSAVDCGLEGRCSQFEGRTCVNMPPASDGTDFPRVQVHCTEDSDCSGSGSGCPSGEDCGPCIIAPASIYYSTEAQEGINCETCHNILPNHRRSCQQFRNSDSVGVLSIDLQERDLDGTRLRLGPYPTDLDTAQIAAGLGREGDNESPRINAFHESARVDTPLAVDYVNTDFPFGVRNLMNVDPEVLRPTSVTCEELPFCRAQICEGGPVIGQDCGTGPDADFNCGGCSSGGTCGIDSDRAGQACRTSVDCATPADENDNVMNRGIADGTLGPLFGQNQSPGVFQLDRPDANYYRSSMFCGTCHDVRPPFGNPVLRSCALQDTHVCSTDVDCQNLNVGCPSNDCGPCVMENGSSPLIAGSPADQGPATIQGAPATETPTLGDPRSTGVRRVENLFSEWQISMYNHPELTYCSGNSFRACDPLIPGQCGTDGDCNVSSPVNEVVTCQDCHMSLFPRVPLVPYMDVNGDGEETPGDPTPKNELYPVNLAAIEGSQSDVSRALPERRVSTHFMPAVDLPLVKFSGQGRQEDLRQEILDSAYKLTFDLTPATATPGATFDVELTIENVGVGHRLPSGFSHERQNWVQLYVQTLESLAERGIEDDPFADDAPCNLQGTIATGADQEGEVNGADELADEGCIYRSGFILDKAHPETGEMTADGSFDDEDPEDFFVVAGTRVRGNVGDARIEVNPGAEGRALSIQYICEEATAEAYEAGIEDGSGIDMLTPESDFPHQVRFCNPNLSPQVPGEGNPGVGGGFTAPGFGNPDCMEAGVDVGPCVPEIELSDADERGRCAHDLSRPNCQDDADCGDAGPCLYACSEFVELQCCDVEAAGTECEDFYSDIGSDECLIGFEDAGAPSRICVGGTEEGDACTVDTDCSPNVGGATLEGECEDESDVSICIRGTRSGLGCTLARELALCGLDPDLDPVPCGSVGECVVENRGIVNFQNQFRSTSNGVCVDPADPFEDPVDRTPKALLSPVDGSPVGCILDLSCTLAGLGNAASICLVNGQCAEDSDGVPQHGDTCTNVTYRQDCGTVGGNSIACNVERNVELNGRPSESVFIQNHPFNFNSLPPLEPRTFEYDFEIPAEFAGQQLIVAARVMNRHFPMRFLRNLIGTQVIRPPFVIENQGDRDDPDECNSPRTIDIDCFVKPVIVLGNAEPGGYFPREQQVRTTTVTVDP